MSWRARWQKPKAKPDPTDRELMDLDEVWATFRNAKTEGAVTDLVDFAWKLLAAQDAVDTRIDSRAGLLFGSVGFSMTLAFSFGGWNLVEKAHRIPCGDEIASLFSVVLALGLATSYLALRALLVARNYAFPLEQSVLRFVDDRANFRKNMGFHLWETWQQRHIRTRKKARWVMLAQRFFFSFLVGILALSIATTYSAITKDAGVDPHRCIDYRRVQSRNSAMASSGDKSDSKPAPSTPAPSKPTSPAPINRPAAPRQVEGENPGPKPMFRPAPDQRILGSDDGGN